MTLISIIEWLNYILSTMFGEGGMFNFINNFNPELTPFSEITYIFGLVGYILPMDTVLSIITITFGTITVRLFISLLKTLWAIIPVL